jgi:hypothetical protein
MPEKHARTWREIAVQLLAEQDPRIMVQLAVDLVSAFDRDEGNYNRSTVGEGMIGKKKEEWMQLCEQAANEQDPAKLMELVAEIERMLAEKENRLKAAKLTGHADKDPESSTTGS